MKNSVFLEIPENFNPSIEIALCFCQHNGKILFLKRHPLKPQGETWGAPGGKIELNETPREAVIREVLEEIGLNVVDDSQLQTCGKFYCRIPQTDYICHTFCKRFATIPSINLNLDEHTEIRWVTYEEAFTLELIKGGAELLSFLINRSS